MVTFFAAAAERLGEIPGIGPAAAAIIIAKIGTDMTRFPPPGAWRPGRISRLGEGVRREK